MEWWYFQAHLPLKRKVVLYLSIRHHDAKTDVSPKEKAKHGMKYVLRCRDLRLPRWYPEYVDSRIITNVSKDLPDYTAQKKLF